MSKSVSKKPKLYWFRNRDVVASRKIYESLKKSKKDQVQEISCIIEEFNASSSDVSKGEDWMDSLPIKNNKDLKKFEDGEQMEYNLQTLIKRQKLRKEHIKKTEALEILECKVNESRVDYLLCKIKCMEEKL